MLKAIILDFNGVIVNDEPLHFMAMRDVVSEFGVILTGQEYWSRYLPLDDESCLKAICDHHLVKLSNMQKERALLRKAERYMELIGDQYPLHPGAVEFVRAAAARYPLALASGARRDEIERTLNAANLADCFKVIVAAEDFSLGKPHPESFLLALNLLNRSLNRNSSILPGECLVIEDAIAGVKGAQAAGMKCLAVSTSYPCEKLHDADRVAPSLAEISIDSLDGIFAETS
jgi:HAD superfamily hydrolase (TIGR01509 family)